MRKLLIFTLLAAAALMYSFCTGLSGQNKTIASYPTVVVPSKPIDTVQCAFLDAFDQYFKDEMLIKGAPGASVVIVRDSSIIWCKGYGQRTSYGSEMVDENSVFRIGSLSKGFAAVLTGVMVQEGKLRFTDKVQQYFPEFALSDRQQAARMQLMHLLSQTTGLPYHAYTNLIEQGLSLRAIAANFPKVKLFGKEGQIYSYQNAAYSLIQIPLEEVSGLIYEDLMREKIFAPAGMRTASASFQGIESVDNKALPHRAMGGNTWKPQAISTGYYNAAPAGGINASAADMGQWLKVLLGNYPSIIADSTLDQVFMPRIRTENERSVFRRWKGPQEDWYAMGWRVLKRQDASLVYHGGFVNDYRAEIALDRKNKVAICILFNGAAPMASDCVPGFFELYWHYWPQNR